MRKMKYNPNGKENVTLDEIFRDNPRRKFAF